MAYEYVGKIVLIEFKTRGTFLQVPTRRIRLCFVKCAYSDLRDIFKMEVLKFLKWIPLSEKDGTQLQNNNFGTSYLHFLIIKQ